MLRAVLGSSPATRALRRDRPDVARGTIRPIRVWRGTPSTVPRGRDQSPGCPRLVKPASDIARHLAEFLEGLVEHFRATGEPPEDLRVVESVAQQLLRGEVAPTGGQPLRSFEDSMAELAKLAKQLREAAKNPAPAGRAPRAVLLEEAVYGEGVVREAARGVLNWAARHGADVTDSRFLAGCALPDQGSLGLHLLGCPECLAIPPYEEQAERLFARCAAIRARIDRSNPAWFDPTEAAIHRFRRTGELHDDPLVRECVLADGELMALMAHYLGVGDAEVLVALDEVAQSKGTRRTCAITALRELTRAGRLQPREP
jgi:hypothetical protein